MSFQGSFIGALGGTSAAELVPGYLARNLLENRLRKDLEDHKALKRDWENQSKWPSVPGRAMWPTTFGG